MNASMSTLSELEEALPVIWDLARRLGLDPYPVHFEVVPATILYEFGSYGLPGRFSHWTHGRAYQQIKTTYDYGLSKIYELVINTNPAYGFLLDSNSVLQNKLVAAHVLAHVDFFRHNAYFAATNRQIVESVSLNAERIRGYEFVHGRTEVESFLDAVLSIQEHVDPHQRLRRREVDPKAEARHPTPGPYDDLDPPEVARPAVRPADLRHPVEPERDLLRYIAENGRHLEDWQRDLIEIVRQEQLYFVPQMQTKIMNEGWASYWHARIIRELDLTNDEYVEFSRMHASILTPNPHQINPYYVGMKIFEDIERRWDAPTTEEMERLGRTAGGGLEKIRDVMSSEGDASFLRNYLTEKLVEELDLYVYRLEGQKWVIVEKDWEKVRDALVADHTNFGYPYIVVEDGDYRQNGELYLRHVDEGKQLDLAYADRALAQVRKLWGRTIHLELNVDGKPAVIAHDGTRTERRPAADRSQ